MVSTPVNTLITIDVLTAAVGEPGATLTLSRDLIKPDYGEILKVDGFFNNGDGTLTYKPDLDYVSRPNEPGGDPVPVQRDPHRWRGQLCDDFARRP